MKIDIRKTVIKHKLLNLFLAIGVTTLIILILLTGLFDKPIGRITKFHITIVIACIYLVYVIYNHLRGLNYIYYNDEKDKLILRFYSLNPISQMKNSIEIPKQNFKKFEVETSMFGIKEKLILYQNIQKGLFKYPPVSITALKKPEKEELINSLKRYMKNS
jgi:hypothetical protein